MSANGSKVLRGRVLLLTAVLCSLAPVSAGAETSVSLSVEGVAVTRAPLVAQVTLDGVAGELAIPVRFLLDDRVVATRDLTNGTHDVQLDELELTAGRHRLSARWSDGSVEENLRVIPGWLSILPPLIAIGLALIFKDVLLSLSLGIFCGAMILYEWKPVTAFARTVDHFVARSVADFDHARIIVFTTLLGGMVGLISRSGGAHGIVDRLGRYATSAKRGQVATWLLGVLIFFDDYSNTLIVGSTMRPITDGLKISREKLAYIVDSTAAPVASVFPISSWIGFEVGLIAAAFAALDLPYNAYNAFLASIPFRFYPIFALVLGFTIAFTGRDWGPMLKAERRAATTGKLIADGAVPLASFDAQQVEPPAGAPRRALNAMLPILAVMIVTVLGMYVSGSAGLDPANYASGNEWLREVFGAADSYSSLMWGSAAGLVLAALLALLQRILTLRQSMEAVVQGFKSMLLALVVLVLAWSIGSVCGELHTADYVVTLTAAVLSPVWLPVLVFLISAAVAFATGTSWGTLSILMPLVIPIAHGLSIGAGSAVGSDPYWAVMIGTISSVLAGSVWGDHCSPISDTTILSSTASGSDHIAHVRTQMPYALAAGLVGMAVGDIPTAMGLNPWWSLLSGSALIVGAVLLFGKKSRA